MKTYITRAEAEQIAADIAPRLRRAEELCSELETIIQQYGQTSPQTCKSVIAEDRLSWSVVSEARPPFDQWQGPFNDALHNIRAFLDNLAWGLATAGGVIPGKPTGVQFSLASDERDWKSQSKRIQELPVASQAAIESLQPFRSIAQDQSTDSHALCVLARLSNTEKHRFAFAPSITPAELAHSFSVEFRTEEEASQNVPPDVTFNVDMFSEDVPFIVGRTKHPIVQVTGTATLSGTVVIKDGVLGNLGVTYTLKVLGIQASVIAHHVLEQSIQPESET